MRRVDLIGGVREASSQNQITTSISVGRYLARRLRQCGVDHLFGLPGDFNLALLDEMTQEIEWVGSTNELNASYAADGYARVCGLGAIVTTYGVGELSAVNGVAGAAAESVPVVQITGSPGTLATKAGSLLHHTLVDGDFDHFVRVYDEVTTKSATLTAENAAGQIDEVLSAALRDQQPVYLRVPVDIATAPVSEHGLSRPLAIAYSTDAAALADFADQLLHALDLSRGNVVVLVGHLTERYGLADVVARLADSGVVRIATLLDAKGLLDESHPAHAGTYIGDLTQDAATRDLVDRASTVITVGVVLSDLLTGTFSHSLGTKSHIAIDRWRARVDDQEFCGVSMANALAALEAALSRTSPDVFGDVPAQPTELQRPISDQLTQEQLWCAVQQWLPSGTPIVADAGTAYYGAAALRMTGGTRLIGQPIWSSIGYTLPATLGIGLASPERPLLLIGDGSAQLTVQELATFAGRAVYPVIVLINNRGYTVERAIRSPEAHYQDVPRIYWTRLVEALLPDDKPITCAVNTHAELRTALDVATSHPESIVFIEAFTDPLDMPPLLSALARKLDTPSLLLPSDPERESHLAHTHS